MGPWHGALEPINTQTPKNPRLRAGRCTARPPGTRGGCTGAKCSSLRHAAAFPAALARERGSWPRGGARPGPTGSQPTPVRRAGACPASQVWPFASGLPLLPAWMRPGGGSGRRSAASRLGWGRPQHPQLHPPLGFWVSARGQTPREAVVCGTPNVLGDEGRSPSRAQRFAPASLGGRRQKWVQTPGVWVLPPPEPTPLPTKSQTQPPTASGLPALSPGWAARGKGAATAPSRVERRAGVPALELLQPFLPQPGKP